MKQCSKCGVVKPYEYFSKNKNSKDNHQGYCKQCANKISNQQYKSNPQKAKQQAIEWMKNNPDKVQKHKEKFKLNNPNYGNEWVKNNVEKNRESKRKYHLKQGIGVYGLWNKIEQCWDYVGEGQLKNREIFHKQAIGNSTPWQVKLNIWFDGWDNVYEFRILCQCENKQQCEDMETKYIDELNPRYNNNKKKRQHKTKA